MDTGARSPELPGRNRIISACRLASWSSKQVKRPDHQLSRLPKNTGRSASFVLLAGSSICRHQGEKRTVFAGGVGLNTELALMIAALESIPACHSLPTERIATRYRCLLNSCPSRSTGPSNIMIRSARNRSICRRTGRPPGARCCSVSSIQFHLYPARDFQRRAGHSWDSPAYPTPPAVPTPHLPQTPSNA